jgi:hypothetical protein
VEAGIVAALLVQLLEAVEVDVREVMPRGEGWGHDELRDAAVRCKHLAFHPASKKFVGGKNHPKST